MSITIYDENDQPIRLRTRKIVCPQCDGTGRRSNPAIDGNGITADEMYELGPEFEQDYMSGVYDIACDMCNGANVVDEVDEDDPHYTLWLQQMEDEHEMRQMERMERMMGC